MDWKNENNIAARKYLIKHTWLGIKLFLFSAGALILSIVALFIFTGLNIVFKTILITAIIMLSGIMLSIIFGVSCLILVTFMAEIVDIVLREYEK